MISTPRRHLVALFTTATLASATLHAQDVLISEVRADNGGRWVELHNRSQQPADLSTWSLHYASKTPGQAQQYWWPFPAGTVMAPGTFLRVNWFQNGVNQPGATELWTGMSAFGFLFGLGGEQLLANRGACGLFRTQQNAEMNTAALVADWVSWGEHDFPREALAIAMNLWAEDRHLPAIAAGHSLARDPALVGAVAFPDLAWFTDNSPTPLLPNVTGAVVQSHGQPCVVPGNHLLGMPTLQANGLPLRGSATFALSVANTTGILGEYAVVAFTTAAAPVGTPALLPAFAGVACPHAVDLVQLITAWVVPCQIVATPVPLPLANVPPTAVGFELHAQAIVLDLMPFAQPPFQGVSNALRIVVGQ